MRWLYSAYLTLAVIHMEYEAIGLKQSKSKSHVKI